MTDPSKLQTSAPTVAELNAKSFSIDLKSRPLFASRHIGPDDNQIAHMLGALGLDSLDELIGQTMPDVIRREPDLFLPATDEQGALASLREIALHNQPKHSFIGIGYYDTILPPVIQRNVLENPGWITAYTPYQPEISQGRLEALLNFQQMIIDLTGLPVANASLLDEATAAAEAMAMARRLSQKPCKQFFVDINVFPQTHSVLKTRAAQMDIELIFGPVDEAANHDIFGAFFQYPDDQGEIRDLSPYIAAVKAREGIVAVACDLLALVLLKSPGEMGADIALGSAQRFGVPMGFGGPHAAFFAARDEYRRAMPGRIIGVTRDAKGKRALRMALQTREQHIRREKANSNICTAQALLANLAAFYAIWHGAEGLRDIAWRIHRLLMILVDGLTRSGIVIVTQRYFDTIHIDVGHRAFSIYNQALTAGYNLRIINSVGELGISFSETTTLRDVANLLRIISGVNMDDQSIDALNSRFSETSSPLIPLLRSDSILNDPVFHNKHSEHSFVRYLKKLQNRDLALDHAMIPLGSCTMKLTATSALLPITWESFSGPHPFAPLDQALGYLKIIDDLETWLAALTGFDEISLQPNSGAQGEYAGLLAIGAYHHSRGESERTICLIPRSAHGTNPASAMLCGLEVVTVECDANGNVDIADLEEKARLYSERLSCLMITYPSTHGVFEEGIRDICALVHHYGGQVYMDGANLNAMVGLTTPGFIGADAGHINLHKTFAIPHGGGGPGVGPIGVKEHLSPFLPGHIVHPKHETFGDYGGSGTVSAAPWGSASILPITWMYITMMGTQGLAQASRTAILSANYLAERLKAHYNVLYVGKNGRVAHECILDIRPIKAACGISETDIAKRLMDYGFHAPTVSFPVAGTLMLEPTESEPLDELERFIDALISIRDEIRQIENGVWPRDDNPLKNAPHTTHDLACEEWKHPYSRECAAFPLPWIGENKFWPYVNRIDEVFGDRNFCCTLSETPGSACQ